MSFIKKKKYKVEIWSRLVREKHVRENDSFAFCSHHARNMELCTEFGHAYVVTF